MWAPTLYSVPWPAASWIQLSWAHSQQQSGATIMRSEFIFFFYGAECNQTWWWAFFIHLIIQNKQNSKMLFFLAENAILGPHLPLIYWSIWWWKKLNILHYFDKRNKTALCQCKLHSEVPEVWGVDTHWYLIKFQAVLPIERSTNRIAGATTWAVT